MLIKVSLLIWYSSCICPLGGTEWLWSWLIPVLPMQLLCESWVKPVRQRCFRLHVNEPSVFWHWKPIPQLWVRVTHSSMSRKERVYRTEITTVLNYKLELHSRWHCGSITGRESMLTLQGRWSHRISHPQLHAIKSTNEMILYFICLWIGLH